MTTWPLSKAGRITRSTKSARAARNKNSSAPNARSCRDLSASLRAASASGVPPGSRTVCTARPSARNSEPSQRTSVDLPAPSGPSTTTNVPWLPIPDSRPLAKRDDRARGALFDAFVDPGINPRHQLFEIRLGRDHLLIHRIRLHALECVVVLLDLFLGGFFALLRAALDFLRQTLRFREHFLHFLILPQGFRCATQRFVFVGLTEYASEVFRLLVE